VSYCLGTVASTMTLGVSHKWDQLKLIMTMVGFEGRFILVFKLHSHLMEPDLKSSLIKEEDPVSSSKISSISGIRNLFLIVIEFNNW
jgi:hypothetical protein